MTYGPLCATFERDMSMLDLTLGPRSACRVRVWIITNRTRPENEVSTELRDVSLFPDVRRTLERAALGRASAQRWEGCVTSWLSTQMLDRVVLRRLRLR